MTGSRLAWRFLAAALAALASASTALAGETPKVVVTIKPIHALVARIMDGVGSPVLLVGGASSPHTFALKPSTARAINDADVFIRVSDQLEPFTRKISESLPASVTELTLADAPGVSLLDQRHGGTFEAHTHAHAPGEFHHDDEDHDHDAGRDGHIWLDPENAKAIVAVIAATLARRYPEYAGKLHENAAALEDRIATLNAELQAELKDARGKPFIVFHDSTQYFESRFGLAAAGSITVSPDVPPSARRLTEVRRKISSLRAVCVFAEPGFQPRLVSAVTEGTDARSGTLDTEGQTLMPGPDLYFDLMRGLAHNLTGCLNAQS